MPFPFQIDILGLILKGVLIGIIASAPMEIFYCGSAERTRVEDALLNALSAYISSYSVRSTKGVGMVLSQVSVPL